MRPFIFNETNAKLDTVLNAFKDFLEEKNRDEDVLLAEDGNIGGIYLSQGNSDTAL